MKKEIKKYTVEEILLAGEIGEVSMIDLEHVVTLLDEARLIISNNKKLIEKTKSKKYKFGSIESQYVMLNKALEKYNITIEEVNKTVDKTINGVYWLDYIEMTESEYNVWREWCKVFMFERCTPKYNPEWIKTQFGDWSLLYSFKVI